MQLLRLSLLSLALIAPALAQPSPEAPQTPAAEAPQTPAAEALPPVPAVPDGPDSGRLREGVATSTYAIERVEGESHHAELYTQASALLSDDDVEAARALYLQAQRLEPDNWNAPVGLGSCALETEDWDTAATHFQAALALKPDSAMALLGLGSAHYARGDWTSAATAWEAGVAADAHNADAWYGAAIANEQLGRPARAAAYARGFVALAPGSAMVPVAQEIIGNAPVETPLPE